MAKKFVRGITDIKNIEHQDFDTNNVNDLLSDGKHNYIHRKKQDGTEEYHNLTDNLKTISSDDSELLEVTNDNDTTNSATIHPKHDAQKEQLLESTDETIVITHGENGTDETTSVDVNPEIVLEHENLLTGDGLDVVKNGNTSTLSLSSTNKPNGFQLKTLNTSIVYGARFSDSPEPTSSLQAGYLTLKVADDKKIQLFMRESSATAGLAIMSYRFVVNGVPSDWREMSVDNTNLQTLLSQKQNTLTSNASIGVSGTGLQQLYTQSQTYTHANGIFKTHVKSVANSSSVSTGEEEFNFLAKMNKTQTSADFTLNEHDTAVFEYLIDTYGVDNKINVCGAAFTLNGSSLNFNTNGAQYNPHIINFNDIIPTSAINATQ